MSAERTDWWVYLVRDAGGELLYIGMTGAGPGRLSAHGRDSTWAPAAASIEVEHFARRDAALARERELIEAHGPRFNIQLNRNRPVSEQAEGVLSVAQAAAIARTSERTIRRFIRAGDLIAEPHGRGHLILEADLHSWIQSRPL